ncbi:DNA-processing protein DprA [Facilibium subflavum]|uniref:DNA-processing protein DprA n=1 Tax=Facilibium subflavum TaxID=2219058 RepID=UPI0013C2E147|nr:DNA-processing protein DprA [Facilibium subflavum]
MLILLFITPSLILANTAIKPYYTFFVPYYLVEDTPQLGEITDSLDGRVLLSVGTIIYVTHVPKSQTYDLMAKVDSFSHDDHDKKTYLLKQVGKAVFNKQQSNMTVMTITNVMQEIQKGDYALPKQELFQKLPDAMIQLKSNLHGKIISTLEGIQIARKYHSVLIDIGKQDGLMLGGRVYFFSDKTDNHPPKYHGEGFIYRLSDHYAIALITNTDQEINADDMVSTQINKGRIMYDKATAILYLTPAISYRIYQRLLHLGIDLDDFISNPCRYQPQMHLSQQSIVFLIHKKYEPLYDRIESWLEQSNKHHLITINSAAYPKLLKEIPTPPLLLFASGDINLLNQTQLAVVGTRHHTRYGQDIIDAFLPDLIAQQLIITSGMAIGIDTLAHKQALAQNGKTIAVLGTGIDICYPYQNKSLYQEVQSNGLIVSEFPLGSQPKRHHFPQRNRIISGLSQGVLVIEAAHKSGSLITAFHAIEQNRDVFAAPGNIFHPSMQGCHYLIQMGAKLVCSAQDILDELILPVESKPHQSVLPLPKLDMDDDAQQIYDCINSTCTSIDQIIEYTNLTYTQITGILFQLEMESLIKVVPGGYQRI